MMWAGIILVCSSWFLLSVTAGLITVGTIFGLLLLTFGFKTLNRLEFEAQLQEANTGYEIGPEDVEKYSDLTPEQREKSDLNSE